MNTDIKNSLIASGPKAQYDQRAKKLLSQKSILAYILVNTVDEFKGMNPKDVVKYIEGDPNINVPASPGLTNIEKETPSGERVIGLNTENAEIEEGIAYFDIIFYVRLKDGLSQMILNIEAQKKDPSEYDILNRAIFYVCRMISSQKEREFKNSNYNDIKRVMSIWVCMNMKEDSLDFYQLANEKIMGNHEWKGKQDLIGIALIGVAKKLSEHKEQHELHRLLGALLSNKLEIQRKFQIIEDEYKIPMNDELRKDVAAMCNLSQGIEDEGYEKGYDSGYSKANEKMIIRSYKKGYTLEEIADLVDMSVEDVKAVIKEQETVLV